MSETAVSSPIRSDNPTARSRRESADGKGHAGCFTSGTDFDSIIGKTCSFYGVDGNRFRVGIGRRRQTFEAIEDPDDGYRSSLDKIATVDESPGGTFFRTSVATVVPRRDDLVSFRGWSLVDATTGHVWLRVGTDDADDYYPCFTVDYQPSGEQVAPA